MSIPKEPVIHSLITDDLPKDHPFAFEELFCKYCDAMVHCFNNECMTMWVEDFTDEKGIPNLEKPLIYCFECFVMKLYRIKEKDRPEWLKR
jgi:hypothetical protein